jgi:hypothetical protein
LINGNLVSYKEGLSMDDFRTSGNFVLGKSPSSSVGYFKGKILYFILFKQQLSKEKVDFVVKYGVLPVPTSLKGIGVFTKDGRPCCEPCTTEPIPGQPGAPEASACVTRGLPNSGSDEEVDEDGTTHTKNNYDKEEFLPDENTEGKSKIL